MSYATLSLIKFNFYELCILQRFPPKRKLTDLFAKDAGQHVFLWIVCRWRKLQPVRNVDKIFVEFFLKITIVSQRTTTLAFALASDVCYFCRSFRFLFLTEFSNSLVFSISSLLWTLKRFCNNHCFGMKNSLFVGAISSFPALAGFKCFSLYTSLHWLVIFWHPDLQFW